jgi:tetratricopeptide (TPR) repeat protein
MFRRYVFPVLAITVLITSTGIVAYAQTGQLRGKVMLKQADGKIVPASDAVIEVYRIDLVGKYTIKAGGRGEFAFAGIPYVGTYVITASREGAQPTYLPGVKAGRDVEYEIEMSPGDGRRYTADEIKTIIAQSKDPVASAGGKESVEDRAKREELEKKNAEIMVRNKKAEESNAIINRTFKAGNEALNLKNYDEAIKQYSEGLTADPDHPGAPMLLTNKASALNARAVARFNAAVKLNDDAAKAAGIEAAKKDWREAYEETLKAVAKLKAEGPPADAAAADSAKKTLYFALLNRADVARFLVPKVDPGKLNEGVTAYEEYLAVETDPVKKLQAEHNMATMLFDANDFEKALARYQKILESNPDDLEALLRSGQALFNIGAVNSDKVKYQEAANYLAKFVEKAPDTNAFKEDAKAILESLKVQENVKPAAPARRRRP